MNKTHSQQQLMSMIPHSPFGHGNFNTQHQLFSPLPSQMPSFLGSTNSFQRPRHLDHNPYTGVKSTRNCTVTNTRTSPALNETQRSMNLISWQNSQEQDNSNTHIWKLYEFVLHSGNTNQTNGIQHNSELDLLTPSFATKIDVNSRPSSTSIPSNSAVSYFDRNGLAYAYSESVTQSKRSFQPKINKAFNEVRKRKQTSTPPLIVSLDDHINDLEDEYLFHGFIDGNNNDDTNSGDSKEMTGQRSVPEEMSVKEAVRNQRDLKRRNPRNKRSIKKSSLKISTHDKQIEKRNGSRKFGRSSAKGKKKMKRKVMAHIKWSRDYDPTYKPPHRILKMKFEE